ncbi:NUMOD4 domain-containing protein [Chryseobacterium phocaeense]|uniref:NUMOD4 domain-containing protein n=1 Tax=Chryseobacterium phocaeense TaxID=1816690 RepID=UPI0009B9A1EF|nr:NUMOD4 domain-containing protein [Chryseobacterium phocaeense]
MNELEDQYLKNVLYNKSLKNLPDEEWKPIEGFENYEISNYGRVKRCKRWFQSPLGYRYMLEELILQPLFSKNFNNYLQSYTYNLQCKLSRNGKAHTKSLGRIVYYHFIEEFDLEDRTVVIIPKDNNRLHMHCNNLEKISVKEESLRMYHSNRAKNIHVIYLQPVSQYNLEGVLINQFDSIYAAEKELGISCERIINVINKIFLTAGAFRWFLQSDPPSKEEFLINGIKATSGKLFNEALWKNLGRPRINKNNPPPCMNLSVENLPGEYWKPIPIIGFEDQYVISNKGRVKRLSGWSFSGKKRIVKEHILFQFNINRKNTPCYLYCELNNKGKIIKAIVGRLLYYCFVEPFDLNDETLIVINKNEPLWDMDFSKLLLCKSFFTEKKRIK